MDTLKLATSPNATPQTDWTFQRALQNLSFFFTPPPPPHPPPVWGGLFLPRGRGGGARGARPPPPARRDFNEWYELWVAVLALRRAVFDDLDRHITEDASAGAA